MLGEQQLKVGDLVTVKPTSSRHFNWVVDGRWKWHGVVVEIIRRPDLDLDRDVVVVFGRSTIDSLAKYQKITDIPMHVESYFHSRLVKISG